MTKLKLAELSSNNADFSAKLTNVNQLSQNEINSVHGGFDLEPAGKKVAGIIGSTLGQAATQGIIDLFF